MSGEVAALIAALEAYVEDPSELAVFDEPTDRQVDQLSVLSD